MAEEKSGEEMLGEAASQIAEAMKEETDEVIIDEEPADEETGAEEEVVLDEAEETDDLEEDEGDSDDPYAELDDHEHSEMMRARKAGWRPKDEYKGNPKDWKDYDEFNAVGDRIVSNLQDRLDSLTQQNDKQRDAINKLLQSQGTIMKQAHEKALKELKDQRKEAIQYGDHETVDALDAEIDNTKKQIEDTSLEPDEEEEQAQKVDDAVKQFIDAEKGWFNESNPDMVRYAISVEQAERQAYPNDDSEKIMQRVRDAVGHRFPGRLPGAEKPRNGKKRKQLRQSPVEGGSTTVRQSGPVKLSDFPPEVQKMAEIFERDHGISKKEYLKQVREGMNNG